MENKNLSIFNIFDYKDKDTIVAHFRFSSDKFINCLRLQRPIYDSSNLGDTLYCQLGQKLLILFDCSDEDTIHTTTGLDKV